MYFCRQISIDLGFGMLDYLATFSERDCWSYQLLANSQLHVRNQEFSSGGVQASLTKKALTFFFFFFFFFSPQLILQKSNG